MPDSPPLNSPDRLGGPIWRRRSITRTAFSAAC
jgi:hypothetical protein